jgi:hypothetical protein
MAAEQRAASACALASCARRLDWGTLISPHRNKFDKEVIRTPNINDFQLERGLCLLENNKHALGASRERVSVELENHLGVIIEGEPVAELTGGLVL